MATNTVFKRLAITGFALAAMLIASRFTAAGDWMPMLPDQDFYDFQLFAPPDLHEYNIYPKSNEGVFFQYDRLYWSITPPKNSKVGNQDFWPVELVSFTQEFVTGTTSGLPSGVSVYGTSRSYPNIDTSWMTSEMTWGNRFEGGWVYDEKGVLISYSSTGPQSQSLLMRNEMALSTPTQSVQNAEGTLTYTPPGSIVPVTFNGTVYYIQTTNGPPDHVIDQEFNIYNETTLNSVELAFLSRRFWSRGSSPIDFTIGARFFQLEEYYGVNYTSYTNTFPVRDVREVLQQGAWGTRTTNNMVGPQIGLHTQTTAGRWSFDFEARIAAVANFQNTVLRGARFPESTAADYFRGSTESLQGPINSATAPSGGGFLVLQNFLLTQNNQDTAATHSTVFTPIGEWRLDSTFKVSKAISLRLGYTGMWMGGIARASRKTAYTTQTELVKSVVGPGAVTTPVQYTQIEPIKGNNWDYLFVNGVDFGIEINR